MEPSVDVDAIRSLGCLGFRGLAPLLPTHVAGGTGLASARTPASRAGACARGGVYAAAGHLPPARSPRCPRRLSSSSVPCLCLFTCSFPYFALCSSFFPLHFCFCLFVRLFFKAGIIYAQSQIVLLPPRVPFPSNNHFQLLQRILRVVTFVSL